MGRIIPTGNLAAVLITILLSWTELCQGQSPARFPSDGVTHHTAPFTSAVGVNWLNNSAPSWTDEGRIIRAQNSEGQGNGEPSTLLQPDASWLSPVSYEACDRLTGCDCQGESQCGGGCESWCPSNFRLSELNSYQTFSYLDDVSSTFVEFEAATYFDLGPFEVENRTLLNVADLPSEIALGPTNPGDPSEKFGIREQGFGDILSATFFSLKNGHQNYHLGIGHVFTFPTATEAGLGSDQYTVGPGAHFSAELGRLTVGFFIWQSWEFADYESGKRINQLFGKPFLLYELSEKWNLIYIPLGLSHSWKSKSGERTTIPIGGGVRRLFKCHGRTLGLHAQVFDYVVRKPKDPEWEVRFTIELLFDE